MRALALLLCAAPLQALACAVCGPNTNYPSMWAYQLMSAILSLTPLAFVGGVVAFVVYKVRQADREETARLARLIPPAASPPAPPVEPGAAAEDGAPSQVS